MKRLLTLLFCGLVPAGLALADGPGPSRKMTDAELSAFNHVRSTIQNALPKAPEGYKFTFEYQSDFDEGKVPEAIKPDQMFWMSYVATYTLDRSLRAEREMSTYMDRAKGTPEQQAELAELDAKDAELTKARDRTRDRAEKDKIRAEMKTVNAEAEQLRAEIMTQYQAWLASGGAATTSQNVDKSLPASELSIRVMINQVISLIDKASPFKVEGFPLVFEQSEGCSGSDTYCITVFLGPFEKSKRVSGYTRYEPRETGPGVCTKVRGMALTIGGPKDKLEGVRDFLQKTDLTKLKSLVP